MRLAPNCLAVIFWFQSHLSATSPKFAPDLGAVIIAAENIASGYEKRGMKNQAKRRPDRFKETI